MVKITSAAFVLGVSTCDNTGRPGKESLIILLKTDCIKMIIFNKSCTLFLSKILTFFNHFFVIHIIACALRKYYQPYLQTMNREELKMVYSCSYVLRLSTGQNFTYRHVLFFHFFKFPVKRDIFYS